MARLVRFLTATLALQGYIQNAQAGLIVPRDTPSTLEACANGATIPNLWSVQDLSVTYTNDETIGPGRANFTISNTQTNYTETIRCNLRANYVCELKGTPGDKDLHLWLQVNLQDGSVTFDHPWPCDGGSAFVIGMARLHLTCPEDFETTLSCYGEATPAFATGSVVLAAKSPFDQKKHVEIPNERRDDAGKGSLTKRASNIDTHPAVLARRGRAMAQAAAHRQRTVPDNLESKTDLDEDEEEETVENGFFDHD
ncbi:hypothetical protein B0T17DRAFT_658662 [Bombardia bombarda]|uniref:Uncharacterized protein n=1 Tax=Bombardia bombarda TaxID=252184 RepID=A0AA39W9R6_9PEZI|nr:hypothetical protein B0T17DRAFT_658662 [Bombardia bombarda]